MITLHALAVLAAIVPPLAAPPVDSRRLDVRSVVYDVRELVESEQAIESGVEIGLPKLELDESMRGPSIGDIVERIRNDVAPGTWDLRPSRGGSSLHELGGNLIVTTSVANHERIEAMLTDLRAAASLQVLFDVLVILDGDDPIELPEGARTIDQGEKDEDDTSRATVAILDPEQASALRRAIEARRAELVTAPKLLVGNGRSASVIVGGEHAIELPLAGDPLDVVTTVRPLDGLALLAVARVAEDRRTIRLELGARTAEFPGDDPSLELAGRAVAGADIDDGGAVAVRIPRVYARLEAARLDEQGELVDIVRKLRGRECAEGGAVLIAVQASVVEAERGGR